MWRHCIWQEYIITSNQANQACSMNPLADPFRGSLCPFSCARFSTGAASAAAAAAGAGASAAEDAMEGSTRRQTGEVCEDVTCSQRYWKNWDDMYVYIIYIYVIIIIIIINFKCYYCYFYYYCYYYDYYYVYYVVVHIYRYV